MKHSGWLSAFVLSAGLCTAAFGADNAITGTVKLNGKAPERKPITAIDANPQCKALHSDPVLDETIVADDQGHLANVVVFLKGDNVKGEAPKEPAKLDQVGCQYVPHVISMTVGQELVALNDDAFLHNVHSLPENSEPSNVAMPNKDRNGIKLKPVKGPEVFKVKCDVHPWMSAWVAAFDHPYHGVTGEDGTYEIDATGLKDGDYTVVAWHEKFKESKPAKVTIKGGKPSGAVDFAFDQKAAAGPQAPAEREVQLATLKVDGKAAAEPCCEGGKCDEKAKPAVVSTTK